MIHGLRRIIISVADQDRALRLYRDVFGLAEKYRAGEVVALALPGGDLELLLHERPPTSGLAGVAVSLLVDDVDAVTAAAETAGATVVDAPADQPWGERQAVLTDPDGHVLCLVAPPSR
jgi:catechol 2,3-dioxygenase-like lactoylglutathione lyase family enzyme